MHRAIRLPTTSVMEVHQYAMSLLTSGRPTRALEIFRLNRQLHPDEKFWTYLGLARGYTATGDKKSAIANWEIALRNVPPNLTANVPAFEKALKALKEGR
jgi:tetratricopeptide (TPR) repeat protein